MKARSVPEAPRPHPAELPWPEKGDHVVVLEGPAYKEPQHSVITLRVRRSIAEGEA